MILFNNGPVKGPWGQKPEGGGRQGGSPPPDIDLDAMLRDAQEKFKRSFGGGPGRGMPGAPRSGFGLLFLAIVLLWLGTGLYRVQPSEHGVLLTFGKWSGTKTEAGLGYHLPWPVQTVRKVDVAQDRRVAVGFRDEVSGRGGADANVRDVPSESLMVTGDENIVNIDFVVLWNINDAGKYLFQIRDPENTIKKVAESAMREIIGRTKIQMALTEARSDIEHRAKELMQSVLDTYSSGIMVNNVQLLNVEPPASVVDAFDDVQRSRADRERLRNEADAYMNDIVPKARGEAQKLLQSAEGYKEAVTSRADGEAKRFLSVYAAYSQNKDITTRRLYLETMQEVMKSSRKVVIGDKSGAPVLPWLPLDQTTKTGK